MTSFDKGVLNNFIFDFRFKKNQIFAAVSQEFTILE